MIIDETNYSLKGKQVKDIANRITANHDAIGDIGGELASKQDALSQAQLDAVNSGIDSTKVAQIATNTGNITTINGKIPAQATSSNQLADKDFVNSSIATNTANFRGNWENWTNVPTDASEYPADDDGNHEPTTNDYMVVQDASGFPVGSGEPALAGTWRFKYSGTWTTNGKNGWLPEYQVNETPLTAAQLAALNSGITDTAVTKLNGIEAGAEVNDINSVSVNGTPVTPDENKNVNLPIEGGIKTLTTADFNYPTTGTKTAVALWLLEPGIYKISGNDVNYRYTTTNGATFSDKNILIVSKETVYFNVVQALIIGQRQQPACYVMNTNGTLASSSAEATSVLLGGNIIDNLFSTFATAPLSANQGRILNNKIEGRVIQNAGAPTTSTVGTVGILLEDTTNGKLYQLTAIDNTDPQNIVYTWTEVGGGSGPTVVQTTGTSTTDVMSQNAVTSMVYADPGTKYKIAIDSTLQTLGENMVQIGAGASATGNSSVAVGRQTNASALRTIAIGHLSKATGIYSIALGSHEGSTVGARGAHSIAIGTEATVPATSRGSIAFGATATVPASSQGVMSINSTNTSYGYNSSNYRLLTGLYDPQSAHDAANKGYTDTKATITMTTTDPGEGAPIDANELIGYYS